MNVDDAASDCPMIQAGEAESPDYSKDPEFFSPGLHDLHTPPHYVSDVHLGGIDTENEINHAGSLAKSGTYRKAEGSANMTNEEARGDHTVIRMGTYTTGGISDALPAQETRSVPLQDPESFASDFMNGASVKDQDSSEGRAERSSIHKSKMHVKDDSCAIEDVVPLRGSDGSCEGDDLEDERDRAAGKKSMCERVFCCLIPCLHIYFSRRRRKAAGHHVRLSHRNNQCTNPNDTHEMMVDSDGLGPGGRGRRKVERRAIRGRRSNLQVCMEKVCPQCLPPVINECITALLPSERQDVAGSDFSARKKSADGVARDMPPTAKVESDAMILIDGQDNVLSEGGPSSDRTWICNYGKIRVFGDTLFVGPNYFFSLFLAVCIYEIGTIFLRQVLSQRFFGTWQTIVMWICIGLTELFFLMTVLKNPGVS